MRTLYRIFCTLTISALISGSSLVAQAQQDDQYNDQPPAADQQYDQQQNNNQAPVDQQDQQYNRDDNQPAPYDQQASPRQDQRDDQNPSDQRYDQNSDDQRYDQNSDDQRYDQNQAPDQNRGYDQNQRYDQNQTPDQNQSYDQNQDPRYEQNPNDDRDDRGARSDRVAPDPQYQEGARPEDQPLETPQYDARNGAPENNSGAATPDPPGRAARLQFTTGSVSIQPQGNGDWITGEVNRPLTDSDNIWADKDSRAEIGVGSGIVRIGAESSLTITNITDNLVQLQLHQGALILHIRRLDDGEKYEVDTPNQAFTAMQPGDYRFDVDSDGDKTIITVWRGEGESTGDGPAVRVHANEQVRFANGTSMTVDSHAAPAPDAFDQWAGNRDNRFDHSESARYVSPNMVGTDDLDEYGTWRNTPDYGNVWTPSVAPGWSPYTNGHWIYQYPWGWTWVEYEPWGYAPFHYGRWVYAGGFWGWAPGSFYARPYYAPALVAWFGGGVGIGIGFGGGFGWCPLGWGEPFIPWYGVSFGYFGRVNFGYNRFGDLHGIYGHNFDHGRLVSRGGEQLHYANMHNPGGFTAVSRDTLVNSRSVARNNLRVSPSALNRMSSMHSPGIAPSRATIAGSRGGSAAVPPQRAFARPVVSRSASPNGSRGSFNSANNRPSGSMGNRGSSPNGSYGGRANGGSMNSRAPEMSSRSNVPRPPSSSYSRPGGQNGAYGRGGSYGRPAPRNGSSAYGRSPYGGGRGPAYGGGAYGRPAPAYGRPAPSYGGRAPGYGGGAYGRPGPSSGGRSAPAYGGGGHSSRPSGGGHAPSGGGGHSSGGGESHGNGHH